MRRKRWRLLWRPKATAGRRPPPPQHPSPSSSQLPPHRRSRARSPPPPSALPSLLSVPPRPGPPSRRRRFSRRLISDASSWPGVLFQSSILADFHCLVSRPLNPPTSASASIWITHGPSPYSVNRFFVSNALCYWLASPCDRCQVQELSPGVLRADVANSNVAAAILLRGSILCGSTRLFFFPSLEAAVSRRRDFESCCRAGPCPVDASTGPLDGPHSGTMATPLDAFPPATSSTAFVDAKSSYCSSVSSPPPSRNRGPAPLAAAPSLLLPPSLTCLQLSPSPPQPAACQPSTPLPSLSQSSPNTAETPVTPLNKKEKTPLSPGSVRPGVSFAKAASAPPSPPPPKASRLLHPIPIPSIHSSLRRCFRCLGSDHLVALCRDPVQCRLCGDSGHRGPRCPSRRRSLPMARRELSFAPEPESPTNTHPTPIACGCSKRLDISLQEPSTAIATHSSFPRPSSIQVHVAARNVHVVLVGPNDEAAFFRVPRLTQPAHETGQRGIPMINVFTNSVGIIRNVGMMPGMLREIASKLLAKATIAAPTTVMHAATPHILRSVCPGLNLYEPAISNAGRLPPLPASPPASQRNAGVKRRRTQEPRQPEQDTTLVETATSGLRPRSRRLADKQGPLFVDVVAQASYLKAKKMGEDLPPPLSVKQLQVLGEGCKLEKKKIQAIRDASSSAMVPSGTE